jgi:hypothetical protein
MAPSAILTEEYGLRRLRLILTDVTMPVASRLVWFAPRCRMVCSFVALRRQCTTLAASPLDAVARAAQ